MTPPAERGKSSVALWINNMPDERVAEHGFVYHDPSLPPAVSFEAQSGKWVRVHFDPATGDVEVQTLKEAGQTAP